MNPSEFYKRQNTERISRKATMSQLQSRDIIFYTEEREYEEGGIQHYDMLEVLPVDDDENVLENFDYLITDCCNKVIKRGFEKYCNLCGKSLCRQCHCRTGLCKNCDPDHIFMRMREEARERNRQMLEDSVRLLKGAGSLAYKLFKKIK